MEAGAALIVAGVFQEQLLYGTVLMCMESAIRMEDVVLCEEAFELMDWSDRRLLHQVKWERNMLNAFCSVNYHPLWVKLLQILVSREDGMKEMYVIFWRLSLIISDTMTRRDFCGSAGLCQNWVMNIAIFYVQEYYGRNRIRISLPMKCESRR